MIAARTTPTTTNAQAITPIGARPAAQGDPRDDADADRAGPPNGWASAMATTSTTTRIRWRVIRPKAAANASAPGELGDHRALAHEEHPPGQLDQGGPRSARR